MFQHFLVQDEHVAPLAEGVLTTLERVGVLCQNEELTEALGAAGAAVERGAQRVRFPRPMVEAFVADLRAEFATAAAPAPGPLRPSGLPGVGGQVAQLYHDFETGEVRSANSRDFVTLLQLGEALHGEQGVGHALAVTDVPPILEPLHSALLLAEYTTHPAGTFAWHVDQIPWLVEMGQILGRENWFSWGAICFAHPLRFDRDTAAKLVARVRHGQPAGLTAMPVAGVTTPVTVEGFVVVAAAEFLATWLAGRALDPHIPLYGSMWPGTVDMRSGAVSYSNPDSIFYGCACCEFVRRWTGVRLVMGGSEYCDAREPSLYAGLEKALKAMMISAFTGQPLGSGGGMVDEGKVLSPLQLLIDREYAIAMNHLTGALEPTPERIALDEILEVDLGLHLNHLQTEHTLRYLRQSLWLPELMDRSGWSAELEGRVLERMRGRIRELLASYRKPEGREEQLAAMREVFARAKQALLGRGG